MAVFLNIIFDAADPSEAIKGKQDIKVHHEKCKSFYDAQKVIEKFDESTIHQVTITYTVK